jgi:hypothetical protein
MNIWHLVSRQRDSYLRIAIGLLALAFIASADCFAAGKQTAFDSPQAGVDALVKAVKANDAPALRAIFGPDGSKLLYSGDAVEDAQSRETFNKAFDESNKIAMEGDTQATLVIGKDEWTMPIPLVKDHGSWRFDTAKGEDEILKRRIGRNELEAMQVCLAIVDAQREYAAQHLDSDGVPVYAARLTSSEGKRDGLYWPTQANETPSPLGSLLAAAADEGYASTGALHGQPYHGYYYRILASQGKSAPDGARDYMVKGKLMGGFAVIAYPARYGASGLVSFMVNHDGAMYERDLGSDTPTLAKAVTTFDPATGWKKAEPTK